MYLGDGEEDAGLFEANLGFIVIVAIIFIFLLADGTDHFFMNLSGGMQVWQFIFFTETSCLLYHLSIFRN